MTSRSPSLLAALLALLLSLAPLVSAQRGLTFSLQTLNAPWSARSTMQVELMARPLPIVTSTGQLLTVPANALVLQGSAASVNDVWLSSNRGVTWQLIAGVVDSTTRAYPPYDSQSFIPASYGGFTVDANSTIFRIGGRLASGDCTASTWLSTDGQTWREQVPSASSAFSPLRDETTAIANSRGYLFLFGGRECNAAKTPRNDVWRSTDQGRSWQLQTREAPWSARVGPFSLNMRLRVTGGDVLLFFTGVASRDTNDVWASADDGQTWQLLTAQAQFPSRNNVNAEVTEDGLIVMTSGKHDHPDGRREYLNDGQRKASCTRANTIHPPAVLFVFAADAVAAIGAPLSVGVGRWRLQLGAVLGGRTVWRPSVPRHRAGRARPSAGDGRLRHFPLVQRWSASSQRSNPAHT